MRRLVPNELSLLLGYAVALIACSGGTLSTMDITTVDGGRSLTIDASSGARGDASMLPPGEGGGGEGQFSPSNAAAPDADAARRQCLNLVDDDNSGTFDCQESVCGSQPLCCIGSSNTACCVEAAAVSIDFSSCAPGMIGACTAQTATAFGTSFPFLRDGTLIPNGTRTEDSGIALNTIYALDTTSVSIQGSARLAGRCSGCVDGVGIGLSPTFASAPQAIAPIAAIVLSGTLAEVRFFVDGTLRRRTPLTVPANAIIQFTLTRSADGAISMRALHDGAVVGAFESAAPTQRALSLPAKIVVYGRSTNAGAGVTQTGLQSLQVSTRTCDNPQAVRAAADSVLPHAGFTASVRAMSITANGRYAVFSSAGSIYYTERNDSGRYLVPNANLDNGTLVRPLVSTTSSALVAGGALDPFLAYHNASGRWRLFFTAIDGAGRRSIAQALGSTSGTLEFETPTPFVVQGLSATDDVDAASLVETPSGTFMFYRVRTTARSEIRVSRLDAALNNADTQEVSRFDTAEQRAESGTAVFVPTGIDASFARDEVAAPEALWINGVCRIYFAGRNGARWAIGLLASQDMRHFSLIQDEPIWSGGSNDSNLLGVVDPSPSYASGTLQIFATALASNGSTTTQSVAQILPTRP